MMGDFARKMARALRGAGEGYHGRGTQFMQGLQDQAVQRDARRQWALVEDAFHVKQMIEAGNISAARKRLMNRYSDIKKLGGDPRHTMQLITMLNKGDDQGVLQQVTATVNYANQFGLGSRLNQDPAQLRTFEALMAMTQDPNASPERIEAAKVALGIAPRMTGSAGITTALTPGLTDKVAGSQATIAGAKAKETESSTKQEGRRAERIAFGYDAAKGIPTALRGLELLKRVETGGVDAIDLKFRTALGIESADQGELSNKLGKAVLSQLRATFGAQFTEREGKRLENIEASFGKNTATNRRLLSEIVQMSTKYANQAIQDAIAIEDYATAAAIKDAMSFRFDEDADWLGLNAGVEDASELPPGWEIDQ